MNTPLPSDWLSKSSYASTAWFKDHLWVNNWSTSRFFSATKSAHSACPYFEKVQLPIRVTCLLKRSLLTSNVTSPPSPTKQALPQVFTHLTAFDLAEGEEDASIDALTPSPLVWSLICVNKSVLSSGLIIYGLFISLSLQFGPWKKYYKFN